MSATVGLVFVGIWTIIQSIGFGSLAFMGLLAHTCQMTMNGTRLSHFIYAVYFRDNECKPVNWTLLLGHVVPEEPIMPDVTQVASRTHIFAMAYFIISILWLVTSIMLITGTCIACMGKCGYYMMFHPWIYITIANVILDAVACGFFIWDLVESMSWSSFLHHMEVENASVFPSFPDEYLLAIPSIIMLCVSARLLIFWVLNIALIPCVISLSKRSVFGEIRKGQRESVQLNTRPSFEQANPNNNNQMAYMIGAGVTRENGQHLPNEVFYQSQNARMNLDSSRYSDPVAHQHTNIPEYNRPAQVVYPMNARRRLEPLKGRESPVRSEDDSFNGQISNITDVKDNTKNSKLENLYLLQDKHNQRSPSIDKASYLGEYEQKRLSIERPHLTPTKPSKLPNTNNELSNESTKSRTDSRQSFNNPPAELRGQLPWSYFKSRDDVSGPKKTFTQLREDEEIPPVPVPDYTLHFPRKDRPRTSSAATDDGKWNGPEARY